MYILHHRLEQAHLKGGTSSLVFYHRVTTLLHFPWLSTALLLMLCESLHIFLSVLPVHCKVTAVFKITYTHTNHTFNGPISGTTRVSQYQKGKIDCDFTEARDSEWQRHQLGHMQVCTSLQTNNHANGQFSQTRFFPWQLSHSLIFPGFQTSGHPVIKSRNVIKINNYNNHQTGEMYCTKENNDDEILVGKGIHKF